MQQPTRLCSHKFLLSIDDGPSLDEGCDERPKGKISTSKINPNILTASYLGDVVSGEFYKQYKAPTPNGRATAITRFRRLFRRIQLERELEGRRLARRGVEEEGKKR